MTQQISPAQDVAALPGTSLTLGIVSQRQDGLGPRKQRDVGRTQLVERQLGEGRSADQVALDSRERSGGDG